MNIDTKAVASAGGVPILTPRTTVNASILNSESWKVVGTIGEGDFGDVKKAILKDPSGGKPDQTVAIKEIQLADVEESRAVYIKREIQTLSQCKHQSILEFVGVAEEGTTLFLLCAYMENGDLEQVLLDEDEKYTDLLASWPRRIKWAVQLTEALQYLHALGIMHRDIKCDNVLLSADWDVKLADFGLARILELQEDITTQERIKSPRGKKPAAPAGGAADAPRPTLRRLSICGTETYQAPEVMLGMQYSLSCDVFSLGIVFAALATGKLPGEEFWDRAYGSDIEMDEFDALVPDACPTPFADLTRKCVEFEADKRPSLAEVKNTLSAI